MKNFFAGVLWLSASLFSLDSNAAYLRCDGCSTSAMRSKAISAGFGTHYVADFRSGNVLGYMHAHPRAGGGRDVAVPVDVQEMADVLADVYQQTSGTMTKVIVVDSDNVGVEGLGGATAYDFIGEWPLRARVQDRLWADVEFYAMLGGVETFYAIVGPYFGWRDAAHLEIKLVFTDGSSVVVVLSADTQSAEYVERSGRDASGNSLVESNSRRHAGAYYFSDIGGVEDFLRHAESLGIPVVRGGSGTRVRCTWDGVTLSCKII